MNFFKNNYIKEVNNVEEIEYHWKMIKLKQIANIVGLFLATICFIGFVIAFSYNIYNVANFITILGSWILCIFMFRYSFLKVFKSELDELIEFNDEALKRLEIFDNSLKNGQKLYLNTKTGAVTIK